MSSVSPALRSPIGSASPCSEDVSKRIHYAKSGEVAGIAEIFVRNRMEVQIVHCCKRHFVWLQERGQALQAGVRHFRHAYSSSVMFFGQDGEKEQSCQSWAGR